MHYLGLLKLLHEGDQMPDALVTAYKYPTLDSGLSGYAYLRHSPGNIRRTRVVFGKPINDAAGTVSTPTITVTDDGSTGHVATPVLNFPTGVISVLGAYGTVGITVNGSWSVTTPQLAVGIASGTGAAAASSTLTGAPGNLLAAATVSLSSRAGTYTAENLQGIGAITDSTGATASTTWPTIAGTATYNSADVNRLAVATAQTAAFINKFTNSRWLTIDGSSTAANLYLNFGVASDPGSSGNTFTISSGSYVDLMWIYHSAISTAPQV